LFLLINILYHSFILIPLIFLFYVIQAEILSILLINGSVFFFFFFNYVRQEAGEKIFCVYLILKIIFCAKHGSFANYVIITKDTFAEEDRV